MSSGESSGNPGQSSQKGKMFGGKPSFIPDAGVAEYGEKPGFLLVVSANLDSSAFAFGDINNILARMGYG